MSGTRFKKVTKEEAEYDICQSGYSTAMVIPDLGTWWVTMEPCY